MAQDRGSGGPGDEPMAIGSSAPSSSQTGQDSVNPTDFDFQAACDGFTSDEAESMFGHWTLPLNLAIAQRYFFNLQSDDETGVLVKMPTFQAGHNWVVALHAETERVLAKYSKKQRLNQGMLKELYRNSRSGNDDATGARGHVPRGLIRQASSIANGYVDSIENDAGCAKLYLQQVVYSAIPALYRVFAPNPEHYKANQKVDYPYVVLGGRTLDEKKTMRCLFQPDAAIVIPNANLPVAMMELLEKNASYRDKEWAFFKCAVATSTTLLALAQGSQGTRTDMAVPLSLVTTIVLRCMSSALMAVALS